MDLALLWPAGLTALLAYGAYSDIKDRRLPNWLSLMLLVFGLAYAFAGGGIESVGWHFLHAFVALLVGMVLFAVGAFGGGDAKFYAGTAAYFSFWNGLNLLLWVSLTGLVAIVVFLVGKRVLPKPETAPTGAHAKFPYGVAIASGGAALAWVAPYLV